jgi:hypothetical protein
MDICLPCKSLVVWVEETICRAYGAMLMGERNFGNRFPCVPTITLNINSKLEENKKEQLIKTIQKHSGAFAWEYTDMHGIHPNTCIHHIYIEDDSKNIKQTQICMNPLLKEIVKDEL